MRRALLISLWFPAIALTLLIGYFLLYNSYHVKKIGVLAKEGSAREHYLDNGYQMYAALPSVLGSFSWTIQSDDARPEIIRRYLEKYNSPLLPYADEIVSISDQQGIDFRLMVSIAQCESNVCKKIPDGSYNCWGFENGATKFSSWEHALYRVAKTLKEGYIDQGLVTPEQIMPKYAPPSVAKGGPWAKCVSHFLEELE